MSTNIDQTIRALKKAPEAVVSVSSDHKTAAIDEALRDLSSLVKALLRKKRCEVTILVVSDPLK
jgi:hypothetical protein